MYTLSLPTFNSKLRKLDDVVEIFDPIRCKYVLLTPEEWVRQHFVNFIINYRNYPLGLISNEVCIKINSLNRRCDTIVYNNSLNPLVVIEYKSPQVKITQDTFNQIAQYNIVLKVKYLIVSNGLSHYCCKIDYENQSFVYLEEIPFYEDVI